MLLLKRYCSAVDHDSVVDLAKLQGMSFCWICDSAFLLATVDGSEIPRPTTCDVFQTLQRIG